MFKQLIRELEEAKKVTYGMFTDHITIASGWEDVFDFDDNDDFLGISTYSGSELQIPIEGSEFIKDDEGWHINTLDGIVINMMLS